MSDRTISQLVTVVALGLLLAATSCTAAAPTHTQKGSALWYNASAEPMAFPGIPSGNGCAHKTAPPGTTLRVEYGGKTVRCVVNDRGPYRKGAVVDLRPHQFKKLAPLSKSPLSGVTVRW